VFEAAGLAEHPGIRMCDPLGYLEFMSLVRGAAAAITDSAGVQEETTFLRVPCLTLRPVTERPVTVTSGSNRLVRADELASAVQDAVPRRATAAVGWRVRSPDCRHNRRLAGYPILTVSARLAAQPRPSGGHARRA
jgi:UDP-N-acetylglucosamine 2-epimerase